MPLKLFLAEIQKLLIPSYPPNGYMFSLRTKHFLTSHTHSTAHTHWQELRLTLQNLLADSTLEGFLWRPSDVPSGWSNIILKPHVGSLLSFATCCPGDDLICSSGEPLSGLTAHQSFPLKKQLPHPEPLHHFPATACKQKTTASPSVSNPCSRAH